MEGTSSRAPSVPITTWWHLRNPFFSQWCERMVTQAELPQLLGFATKLLTLEKGHRISLNIFSSLQCLKLHIKALTWKLKKALECRSWSCKKHSNYCRTWNKKMHLAILATFQMLVNLWAAWHTGWEGPKGQRRFARWNRAENQGCFNSCFPAFSWWF